MPYVPPTPEQLAASNISYAVEQLAQAQRMIANVTASVISGDSAMIFSQIPDENQRRIAMYSQAVLDLQDLRNRLSL